MAFSPLSPDAAIERRLRRRRLVRNLVVAALIALVVIGALRTYESVAGRSTKAHVATKPVTLLSAEPRGDDVLVRARLDAPSANGATQTDLEGLVPASTWKLTHVLWACYPPTDPAKGILRSPLDADCVNLVEAHD